LVNGRKKSVGLSFYIYDNMVVDVGKIICILTCLAPTTVRA